MAKRDILEQLAQDARRLRVARMLPPKDEGPLEWEWIKQIQADFEAYLEKTKQSVNKVSRKLGDGFSTGVLSQFRNHKEQYVFRGDLDRIARGINNFIELAERQHNAPRPKGWIETAVANRMLGLIGQTVDMRCIGVIFSDAGRGKTMTLQAASKIFTGSILVRVVCSSKSPSGLNRAIAHALGHRKKTFALGDQPLILNQLKGTGRPLFIDEAHQLSPGALEYLRDLHDCCGIPIILAGTRNINEKCSDDDYFYGQFSSRIGYRMNVTEVLETTRKNPRPLHSAEEIKRMFESDKVRLTDDALTALAKIGNLMGLGGLRLCKQVVFAAAKVANAKSVKIDASLIIDVLRQMHGQDHAAECISAMEKSKVKIA